MAQAKETLTFVGLIAAGIVLSVIIAALPAGWGVVGLILAIIAFAAAILGFASRYYLYLFDPFRNSKNRTVIISGEEEFRIAPSGNAILQKTEDGFSASAFIKIPLYRSATEMTDEEKLNFSENFSKLLNLSKDPVKICSMTYVINKDEYINRIRTKMNEVEERYNTLTSNKDTPKNQVDRVKGETTMWHNLLDSVTTANSKAQMVYAMVSHAGSTEDEATNLVYIKAQEVAAGIGATLGVTATIISGNEILALLEPEYIVPPTTISELLKRKTEQGA